MLLTTKSFVIISFCHEQLLEMSQTVKFAGSQCVVVQPVSRTTGKTVRVDESVSKKVTYRREERQCVHLKHDLWIFSTFPAPPNSTFSNAYRILLQMVQHS